MRKLQENRSNRRTSQGWQPQTSQPNYDPLERVVTKMAECFAPAINSYVENMGKQPREIAIVTPEQMERIAEIRKKQGS